MAISFDNVGIKTVSKTDRSKAAYVPTQEQVAAIEAAGILPAIPRPAPDFKITVLSDPRRTSIRASYYHSRRSKQAKRLPEPRMGHELITSWLETGDRLLIGNVGSTVFAQKLSALEPSAATRRAFPSAAAALAAAAAAAAAEIVRRAKKAKGKPKRHVVTRNEFFRNQYVVAAVIMRANEKCEMPGCECCLFKKDDGSMYLEAHHIVPLGEGGDDSLANAAALCPHHHRVLHFSKDRKSLRKLLATHIASIDF